VATGDRAERHLEYGFRRRSISRRAAVSCTDGARSLHARIVGHRRRSGAQRPRCCRDAGAFALRAGSAAADLCDNGTEFVSAAMDLWAYTNGVILAFSRRGKPTDNAAIESFNGRFREECLNVHWFASLEDAQQKIDAFRWDYNEHHPHRSLKGLSPREFAERMLQTAASSRS
jgi:putative transposase